MRTPTSIWWGSGHYIDDKKEILRLKAGRKEASREVTIGLATGRRLEPMTDLFSKTEGTVARYWRRLRRTSSVVS